MAFEVDSLFQAMDIILAERLKGVSYDATEICSIVDISDRKNGKYMVSPNNGETKYPAYSESTEYQLNDLVRVSVPNGDYTQKKYIDGKYVDDNAIVPITYISPLNTVVDVTGNLMTKHYDTTFGLISNGGVRKHTLWSVDLTQDASYKDMQASGIYNTIALSAQFKTLLDNYNIRTGSFGLQLDVYTKVNPESSLYTIRTVYLDSSEMFGNPYGFAIFTPQSKKFDLSNLNTVVKLVLSFYQNGDFTYYSATEKKTVAIDPSMIVNDNILVKNVKVGFGSDLSIIADNTLQIYTPNSQDYNLAELESTNEKNIGFLWYNKDENNQYLGFSDGIFDPDYDEIEYIKQSSVDYRLLGQKGQEGIPTDKESLALAADLSESVHYFDNISNLISKEITRELKSFKSRVSTINDWVVLIEGTLNSVDTLHKDYVTKRDILKNTYQEFLAWNAAIQAEKSKREYLQDIEAVEGSWEAYEEDGETYVYPNLQKWYSNPEDLYLAVKNLILSIKNAVNDMLVSSQDFLDNGLAGFKGIFDTYNIRFDKILKQIDQYIEDLEQVDSDYPRMINNHAVMLTYPKTSYIEYVQQDFSDWANKYCIYWYRYDPDDSGEAYDEFAGPKWKRLQTERDFNYESETNNVVHNYGLPINDEPNVIDGKEYYATKSFDTSAMLTQLMHGMRVEEKYKIILFHNHEKYETKELIFTNLDDIPDPTTVDKSAAIIISHADKSQETYQSYGVDNTLVNHADANIKRWLSLSYEGLKEGNEFLAGAQVYWYIPSFGTMLTTNDRDLCNAHGFVSDKGLDTKPDYSRDGYICYYKTVGTKVTKGKDQDGKTIDIISADAEDLGFYYKIKPYYMPTASQNTIVCKVIKGEYNFETDILINFSSYGTSGTDYTLVITPSGAQNAVYAGADLPLTIALYDYNNNEIPIFAENPTIIEDTQTASNFTAEWVGPTAFDGEENISIDGNGAINGLFIKNNTNTTDYYGALKATVAFSVSAKNKEADETTATGEQSEFKSSRLVNLSTIYPLAYSAGDYYIEGATTVVYDSQGGNPAYYKDPYKIFNIRTNEEVQSDIQENESIAWEIHYYKPDQDGKLVELTQDDADYNICMTFMPKLNDANGLAPSTMYMDNVGCYAAVQCWLLERKIKKVLLWAQSIVILQNRYPSAMLNSWDGSLTIDEKNGTILSSMVGAGRKTENNTFEGVLMGDIEVGAGIDLTGNKAGLGIYGFNDGAQSFGFNVDGTGFIGKAGRGRILFDGNEGTIGSASYYQNHLNTEKGAPASAGMLIDLDDGFIDMRGGTNYHGWTDWQGLVNAEYLAKAQAAVYNNKLSQVAYDAIAAELVGIKDVAAAYENAILEASMAGEIESSKAVEIINHINAARDSQMYPTSMTTDYLEFKGCLQETELKYLNQLTEYRTAVEQEYQRGNITADQYHKAIMENNYTLYNTYEDYKERYGELYLQPDVTSKLIYGNVLSATEVNTLITSIESKLTKDENREKLEASNVKIIKLQEQFDIDTTKNEATFVGDREQFYDFLEALRKEELLSQSQYDKMLLTAPVNSHIHIDVKSPYFYIISEQGRRILNIGDDTGFDFKNYNPKDLADEENLFNGAGYYLKSNDFMYATFNKEDGVANTSGAGFLLDLTNGHINAFNLSIASKNVFIDSSANADPFFVIKDNDGCNLIYAGQSDFYLQSHTYARRTLGDRLIDDNGDQYYYPGLRFETSYVKENNTYKYLFDIQGKKQSVVYIDNDEIFLQTDNYKPYMSGASGDLKYGRGIKLDLGRSKIDAYDFSIRGMNSTHPDYKDSYLYLSSDPVLQVYFDNGSTTNFMLNINPTKDGEFYMCSSNWFDGTETVYQPIAREIWVTKPDAVAYSEIPTDESPAVGIMIGGGAEVVVYSQESNYIQISDDPKNPMYISKDQAEYDRIEVPPPINYSDDAGMKFDVCNGKLIGINESERTQRLIIDTSKRTKYPLQIGGFINEKDSTGEQALNFRVGWDGAVHGGSTKPWSISANGTATFGHLNASSGTLSSMTIASAKITSGTIGGIKISAGSISGTGWSLSSTGAKFSTLQVGDYAFEKKTIYYGYYSPYGSSGAPYLYSYSTKSITLDGETFNVVTGCSKRYHYYISRKADIVGANVVNDEPAAE